MGFVAFGPLARPRMRPGSKLWNPPAPASAKKPPEQPAAAPAAPAPVENVALHLTIDSPSVADTLAAVAKAAELTVDAMIFEDTGLAVAARQVALVILTCGRGLPPAAVEGALGMAAGAARRAQAVFLPELRRRAISFLVGPEGVARALLFDEAATVRPVRVLDCCRAAAAAAQLTIAELRSARRQAPVVRARQVGMWLAKEFTGRSLPEIGRQFGGRDHTTVLHAVRKVGAVADRMRPAMPLEATLEQWAEALLAADWKEVLA